MNPFESSETLASWTARTLQARGLDEVAEWAKSLEYWVQVELVRSAKLHLAGDWQHVGDYEQPYYTEHPRSGSKTKGKWIDLVFATPEPASPTAVVWVELKDLSRNIARAVANAKGVGVDLAALWTLDVPKTKDLWANPPPSISDRSRLPEWSAYGPNLDKATHHIAQVVTSPRDVVGAISPDDIIKHWLASFSYRVGGVVPALQPEIAVATTEKVYVYGLVAPLPGNG